MSRGKLHFWRQLPQPLSPDVCGRSSGRSSPESKQTTARNESNHCPACILGSMASSVFRTHVAISLQTASPWYISFTPIPAALHGRSNQKETMHRRQDKDSPLSVQPSWTQLPSTVLKDRLLPVAPSSVSSLGQASQTSCNEDHPFVKWHVWWYVSCY